MIMQSASPQTVSSGAPGALSEADHRPGGSDALLLVPTMGQERAAAAVRRR